MLTQAPGWAMSFPLDLQTMLVVVHVKFTFWLPEVDIFQLNICTVSLSLAQYVVNSMGFTESERYLGDPQSEKIVKLSIYFLGTIPP
jgi:hypothetical protein